MDHPENDAQYAGLAVNKGIEQPPIVNPYLKKMRTAKRDRKSTRLNSSHAR